MSCMEEHEVKTTLVSEQSIFKGKKVSYDAIYSYCDIAEELYMDEQQMQKNDIEIKNAYRKAEGLLTSDEISNIRTKYRISQKDFCILLGWGEKTITRYEGHQVQDKAHDTILKKIDRDPEWFLTLLSDVTDSLPIEAYRKYYEAATTLYETNRDMYLRKAIEANYVNYQGKKLYNGNAKLSLDKVVDVIRYFASSCKVTSLYKVKLMKLMWYADMLSYKKRGFGITGLVYQVLPMGAVPVGHNSIIDLKGVPCEEVEMGEGNAYHFALDKATNFPTLSEEDKQILDTVIEKLGKKTKSEIVSFMHNEKAYQKTKFKDVISFEYARDLLI